VFTASTLVCCRSAAATEEQSPFHDPGKALAFSTAAALSPGSQAASHSSFWDGVQETCRHALAYAIGKAVLIMQRGGV